ncbi:MAG: hypothetical protein LBC20_05575 [Planctomycetaceae bacterium]|jgi:hypothetical protein|nr:hypothetical protein [Planctomycetaceae bacterium]
MNLLIGVNFVVMVLLHPTWSFRKICFAKTNDIFGKESPFRNLAVKLAVAKVETKQLSLSPSDVRLSGFVENNIQNSIKHWGISKNSNFSEQVVEF